MKNELEFGQKGWCKDALSNWYPCIFIKMQEDQFQCITEDGSRDVFRNFSIEKPKRFNVGDVFISAYSQAEIYTVTSEAEIWSHERKKAESLAIFDNDVLLYTAEQLDDPANYTVHKPELEPKIDSFLNDFDFYEIRETEVHGEIHLRVKFAGQWRNIDNLGHFKRLAGFWYSENTNALQNNSVMYDNEKAEDAGGFDNHLEKGGKVCRPKYVAFVKE